MKQIIKKPKSAYRRRTVLRYCNGDVFLLYRLFEKASKDSEKHIGDGCVFSLTVTKIYCKGKLCDSVSLHDITRSRKEALRILKTVSRARVMPDTASEIVGDLIGIQA